ncbi:hypothetical protein ACG9Y7_04120 [Acinetobacter gerneri]|uniref:hypothetical protein n=1 Tax=Acinetobacter gerneri TaxID=202952 RepID=UPI003AF5D883
MSKVLIALTSAVVIAGKIAKAGDEVHVDEQLAKELLHRGRCELVEVDSEDKVDLSKMTNPQLIEFAKSEFNLELDASLNKKQLIEAIQTASLED